MTTLWVAYKSKPTPNSRIALVHEVRNPLPNNNLSLVMLKLPLKATDQKRNFNIITRSTIRIKKIVNKLFFYQNTEEVVPQIQSAQLL